MKILSIDIETFSATDLPSCGVYKYAEDPDFQILLFGYSVDGSDVQVIDLACGGIIPGEILEALTDPAIIKTAFNANFERVCLSRYLRDRGMLIGFIDPEGWRCTMVWAGYMGLPMTLSGAGAVLKLDEQKMEAGKELIRYFCKPCQATVSNGMRTRNYPADAPEKWELFKAYNARDVEVELQIQQRLAGYPVPDAVWGEYRQDQEINDRGILVDIPFVESAIRMDACSNTELTEKMQELTMLDNPNSVAQMKKWLADHGLETDSLGKKIVADILKTAPEPLRSVLLLRQQLAKSSVKKYQAMVNCACADGRVRGMFQFYGANRSGRWAGRNVQLQNLPQNHRPDLEDARTLVRCGDYPAARAYFESVPEVLSELIRTAFIPRTGSRFIVADFSAIEARVLSWLAGEKWRMETFAANKDIYCATASRMFGVPVEKGGVNGHLRQKGKQAELACGYGGSVGAMVNMGALDLGMKEEELKPLVDAWRQSNPHIVNLWRALEDAAIYAVTGKTIASTHGVTFEYRAAMLFVTLPSCRQLCYAKPRIGESRFGTPSITYMGIGATKKWERLETFGGKLTENITQAIARDLLCHAMLTLRDCRIVAHSATVNRIYHDEKVLFVVFDFTNSSISEANAFTYKFTVKAFQSGVECDSKYSANKNASKEIKNGASIQVTKGFVLSNDTDFVEITIDDWISWSSKPVSVYYDPTTKKWGGDLLSLATAAPTANPNFWTCPSCQKEVTSKFCPDCGVSMPTPSPTPDATPVPMNTNAPVQNVVNYTYTLKTSQFEREGMYTGELVDGFPHGFGLFVTHNSKGKEWFYKGEWVCGLPSGEGAEYWEHGQVERGVFKNGLFAYGETVVSGVRMQWLDEYDDAGNQKFVIYNGQSKYADGYTNRTTFTIVSSQYYDEKGAPTNTPQQMNVDIYFSP